jgi:transposase-like protein
MKKKSTERRVYTKKIKAEAAGSGIQAFPGHGKHRNEELTRLRKEVKSLRQENVILKNKCGGLLRASGTTVMAYQYMKANRNRYAIKYMAGLFGISRGAYYKWAGKGVSQQRTGADA